MGSGVTTELSVPTVRWRRSPYDEADYLRHFEDVRAAVGPNPGARAKRRSKFPRRFSSTPIATRETAVSRDCRTC